MDREAAAFITGLLGGGLIFGLFAGTIAYQNGLDFGEERANKKAAVIQEQQQAEWNLERNCITIKKGTWDRQTRSCTVIK